MLVKSNIDIPLSEQVQPPFRGSEYLIYHGELSTSLKVVIISSS